MIAVLRGDTPQLFQMADKSSESQPAQIKNND